MKVKTVESGAVTTLAAVMANLGEFMANYGPGRVRRIAIDRDETDGILLVFSNVGGTVRDGATELIQMGVVNTTSLVVSMQKPTAKLKLITDGEFSMLSRFFLDVYFAGDEKDVFLVAKGDSELDQQKVMFFVKKVGDDFVVKPVAIEDFVFTAKFVFILLSGRLVKISIEQFFNNLSDSTVKSYLNGYTLMRIVGRGRQLARGPLVQLGSARPMQTVAYIRPGCEGGMEMMVLEIEEMTTVMKVGFEGRFVAGSHDGRIVYVINVVSPGTQEEAFTIRCLPTNFFLPASEEPGVPLP